MNALDLKALGITSEDILERAAQKLADDVADFDHTQSRVDEIVSNRINKIIEEKLESRIEQVLSDAMSNILDEEVTPRNIWGEKQGEPTTIRAALSERAKEFWNVKVDAKGKPTGAYGGKPRHEWMMQESVKKEFDNAIKQNINEIVAGFKEAMRKDAGEWLGKYIQNIFPKQPR